jgi:phosphocarrier protein
MEKIIELKSTAGLHASLAARLVQTASMYDVDVKLRYEDKVVDAKSILGLMSLAVPFGKNVQICAEGPDAEKALKNIEQIIG